MHSMVLWLVTKEFGWFVGRGRDVRYDELGTVDMMKMDGISHGV